MAEHEHECVNQQTSPHAPMFGCKCECGATRHWLGWQPMNAPKKENPCAVILEEDTPQFDVEDYRDDLQRRYDSLRTLYDQIPSQVGKARVWHKAAGISIALDMLPRRPR